MVAREVVQLECQSAGTVYQGAGARGPVATILIIKSGGTWLLPIAQEKMKKSMGNYVIIEKMHEL